MIGMRQEFGLTLMVNHACNLRCTYCYTGAKLSSPMTKEVAEAAIDRGLASLRTGGHFDVGFFGGEPLLESARMREWMHYARDRAQGEGKEVRFNLTTNGTITTREALGVMLDEDLDLTVSFDGLPEMHDRHRKDAQGRGSAAIVEATLRELIDSEKAVCINWVVRPDTLEKLPEGLVYVYELGVRHVNLSLDLWTEWSVGDGRRLEKAIYHAAELWRGWLPDFALNWFDMKAGDLAEIPLLRADTRCGFGEGEIAVAPSGRLYPCERLIGEDAPDHPRRLAGHVLDGSNDFLNFRVAPFKACNACSACALKNACDTRCRCGNLVRSGDANRPDGLLCIQNKAAAAAVREVLLAGEPKTKGDKCYG
jgi:uncharacterized protein